MHKLLTGLAIFIFSGYTSKAQLSISLQEPPSGIVQKGQLWNLALIYSGNNSVTVTIGLSLVEISDNQPVLTALSSPVTLTKGIKQLRVLDVSPIAYEYVSPAFSRLTDVFLPIGNYRACYTVYSDAKIASGVLAEDCISIEVQPLSPPQLTMPEDSAKIQTPYPQFSWLPPSPVTLFNDLNYDLILVDLKDGQNAGSAIQENIPLYNLRHLNTSMNTYPLSNKGLDTGRIYAWRVVAKNGEVFAAQSEVWTFKVAPEKKKLLKPAGDKYLELKSDNSHISSGIIPDNVLGLKYYSYDKTHDVKIRFLDAKGEKVKELNRTILYGNNFLVFELDRSFSQEQTYFVEIQDLEMATYRASFRMSK